MTRQTHIITSVMALGAFSYVAQSSVSAMGVTVYPVLGFSTVIIGAWLPDIDLMGRRNNKNALNKLLTHRGLTHTLTIPAIICLLMHSIAVTFRQPVQQQFPPLIISLNSMLFGLMFGWVMHILQDMFNVKGVPILWPIIKRKLHVMRFLTGTWHESVFIIVWLALCLAAVWISYNFV